MQHRTHYQDSFSPALGDFPLQTNSDIKVVHNIYQSGLSERIRATPVIPTQSSASEQSKDDLLKDKLIEVGSVQNERDNEDEDTTCLQLEQSD